MVCGIPMILLLWLLDIPILIGSEMLRIEKTHLVFLFYFINDRLLAWLSKKFFFISLFIVEVEYVVVGSCCTQLLWMKKMLKDYEIEQRTMNIHRANSNAINILKNPILHSCTKHIEIRHHFLGILLKKMSSL